MRNFFKLKSFKTVRKMPASRKIGNRCVDANICPESPDAAAGQKYPIFLPSGILLRTLNFLLILFFCLPCFAAAASTTTIFSDVRFGLSPSTTVVAADPYQLLVLFSADQELNFSSVTVANSEDFWVRAISEVQRVKAKKDFSVQSNFLYQLQIDFVAMQSGELTFPQISFAVNGQINYVCPAARMLVYPSKKPLDPSTFKDIKDDLLRRVQWLWLWISLIVFAVCALLVWIYFKRQKKQSLLQPPKEQLRPAHEVALEKLLSLHRRYKDGLEIKKFYFELSWIFREYLSREFAFDAMEKTTQEIYSVLRAKSVERNTALQCKDLLSYCDLVKFAKFSFEAQETEKHFLEIETFIKDRTKLIQSVQSKQ